MLEKINAQAIEEVSWIQQLITSVRTIRAEMDIEPRKLLPVLLQNHSEKDAQRVQTQPLPA